MSGEIEESDSWGSIVMNGVMNRMAKMTGLRVVKKNGVHEQGQMKNQKSPKYVNSERKNSQQKSSWEPLKTQYKGNGKWRNINPDKEISAMFNQRKADHEISKKLGSSVSSSNTPVKLGKHDSKVSSKTSNINVKIGKPEVFLNNNCTDDAPLTVQGQASYNYSS